MDIHDIARDVCAQASEGNGLNTPPPRALDFLINLTASVVGNIECEVYDAYENTDHKMIKLMNDWTRTLGMLRAIKAAASK